MEKSPRPDVTPDILHGHRPRLALTLGDPMGIGPEVGLKALMACWADPGPDQPVITVVGDRRYLEAIASVLGPEAEAVAATVPVIPGEADHTLEFPPPWGHPTVAGGQASFAWLQRAIAGCLSGEFDGVVTGPIAKSVWHAAGHPYPGQTEVLAEAAGVEEFAMAFVGRSPHTAWCLRTMLATTHIPLAQVPTALTPDRLDQKLACLLHCLAQDFGLTTPHIAVAGLNPHSGEGGQLGTEEEDWLRPWLAQVRSRYPQATFTGPVPPDTLWVSAGQAWYTSAAACPYDAYLALYHDQGLIPVKLMAFDRAVNTTLGLPFVRTSPDHGTAFDIAGRGQADATSMGAAIDLAAQQVIQRRTADRNFADK